MRRIAKTLYLLPYLDDLPKVKTEDLARLSPLGYKHINMLGRYSFSLPESVQKGKLRLLGESLPEEDFE